MSELSDYEYVKIVATIESRFNDQLSCFKCCKVYDKYKEGEKKDKMIHVKKKSKGCFDMKTMSYVIGVDSTQKSVKFYGCAGNYTSLSVNYFVDLFYQYDNGVLPYKGRLGDQPSKIIEIFQLIGDKISKKNEEELEKESRKRRNGK